MHASRPARAGGAVGGGRVRLLRALALGTAAYGVVSNTSILFTLVTPLYVLTGPIHGVIGIVSYRIVAFGRPVYPPPLDMASFLSIIVITSSTLNIAASAALFYLLIKGRFSKTALEAFMASSLTMFVSLGTLKGIRRVVVYELSILTGSYSHYTSAGAVIIYRSRAHPMLAAHLFSFPAYVSLVMPYVCGAVASYLLAMYWLKGAEADALGEVRSLSGRTRGSPAAE